MKLKKVVFYRSFSHFPISAMHEAVGEIILPNRFSKIAQLYIFIHKAGLPVKLSSLLSTEEDLRPSVSQLHASQKRMFYEFVLYSISHGQAEKKT